MKETSLIKGVSGGHFIKLASPGCFARHSQRPLNNTSLIFGGSICGIKYVVKFNFSYGLNLQRSYTYEIIVHFTELGPPLLLSL